MGCAGVGWEVWLDGMEVSQFTYFQVVGELDVKPTMSEITYGVERLASYIQDVNSVFDLEWGDGVKYYLQQIEYHVQEVQYLILLNYLNSIVECPLVQA